MTDLLKGSEAGRELLIDVDSFCNRALTGRSTCYSEIVQFNKRTRENSFYRVSFSSALQQ
jgi:hypothetical protein